MKSVSRQNCAPAKDSVTRNRHPVYGYVRESSRSRDAQPKSTQGASHELGSHRRPLEASHGQRKTELGQTHRRPAWNYHWHSPAPGGKDAGGVRHQQGQDESRARCHAKCDREEQVMRPFNWKNALQNIARSALDVDLIILFRSPMAEAYGVLHEQ